MLQVVLVWYNKEWRWQDKTVLEYTFVVFQPGEFIHTLGDSHVYLNHVEALKVQLTREPRPFPTLSIVKPATNIEDFTADHFQLHNYNPYPKIDMPMAVWLSDVPRELRIAQSSISFCTARIPTPRWTWSWLCVCQTCNLNIEDFKISYCTDTTATSR